MGTHHGKNGVVKVGSNAVAEVDRWSLQESVETSDDTAQGDAAKTHLAGIPGWSGDLMCHWDETDANGQEALTIGASVTLNLYPEGTGAGAAYSTGTGTITNITREVTKNGTVSRSFTFEGNGVLTHTTV